MDKIREEFEKWNDNKEPYYVNEACEKIHEGKDELIDIIDKISEGSFKAGHKSRDPELEKWRIRNDRQEARIADQDVEIQKLKEGLQTIIDLGFDNDGFETALNLKGLIAELVQIAKSTLEDKFCIVCHGYGWNTIDKETGEAEYCPMCNKQALKDGE